MKNVFLLAVSSLFCFGCQKDNVPFTFSAIGDVPYTQQMSEELDSSIIEHNKSSTSSFLIHLGDIKSGSKPCLENIYKEVSDQLREFKTPVFIIPGDNEFNDCENPIEAFSLWNKYFLHFNEHWKVPWHNTYHEQHKENFSWVQKEVLFVGLNLVGGRVHDKTEWDNRLQSNADWIDKLAKENKGRLKAMVVFGHANMNKNPEKFELFTKQFRATAKAFKKPILYLQGDGHTWIKDRPWLEENMLRVQVDAGAGILEVTVDNSLEDPFIFTKAKK